MISYLFQNGGAVLMGIVILVAGGSAWRGRHGGRRAAAESALTTASLAGILAITLGRYGLPSHVSVGAITRWAPAGLDRFTLGFGTSEEIWLNVALFVPASYLLTLQSRRPVAVIGGLAGLSCGIELVQSVLGLGTPDVSDLLANALGAYLGGLAGSCTALALGRGIARPLKLAVIGLAAAGVVTAALVPLAAAHRQNDEVAQLERRFSTTDFADYELWASNDRLNEVFSTGLAFSSGASVGESRAVVRYPTSFMGIQQCVLAEWTETGFHTQESSGSACSAFLG